VSFSETAKALKEIIETTNDITKLGQYCVFLYEHYQWIGIYQTYSKIKELSKESLIPAIFDSLYQFENKSDKYSATQLLKKLDKTSPIEDRCLSILCEKMEKYTRALDYLYRYLDSKESSNDIMALLNRAKLEIECRKPAEALSATRSLLKLIPSNTEVRLANIDALKELNKKSQAIIELSILMGDTSDTTFKAKLYKQRAELRTNGEVNEKVGDLEMSDKLCPELAGRKEMFKFLYKEKKLKVLNEMFNERVTKQDMEKDFDIAIMKGDLCRVVDKNYKKALEIYKYVNSVAPPQYKARVSARIEIIEEQLKHGDNKN
jgi:tetratricopeptide (TPR) repeat protein